MTTPSNYDNQVIFTTPSFFLFRWSFSEFSATPMQNTYSGTGTTLTQSHFLDYQDTLTYLPTCTMTHYSLHTTVIFLQIIPILTPFSLLGATTISISRVKQSKPELHVMWSAPWLNYCSFSFTEMLRFLLSHLFLGKYPPSHPIQHTPSQLWTSQQI